MAQASALPDNEPVFELAEDDDEVVEGEGEKPAEVSKTPRHTQLDGGIGYHLFSRDGYGGRAAPYEDLRPGPTGGLQFTNLDRKLKYSLEGAYVSDRDFHGDFLFDRDGDYRFHLRTESLWHNLDRKPLFSPDFPFGRADSFTSLADYIATPDPAATYGLRVEQDQVRARIKIHEWPLHLNLGYWRLVREGTAQLRYADHAFEGGRVLESTAAVAQAAPTLYDQRLYQTARAGKSFAYVLPVAPGIYKVHLKFAELWQSEAARRPMRIEINGRDAPPGRDVRVGRVFRLEGDDLVIWLRLETTSPVRIAVRPAGGPK